MKGRSTQLLGCTAVAAAAAAAAAAAGTPGEPPHIFAVRPEADTYVTAAQPDANFGRSLLLRAAVAPQATAYVRFRLKKVRGAVASVTLLLHAHAGARASYQVRRVYEDDWREQRLTYANAPRLSLRYTSSKPVRRRAWNAVDVTSFVSGDERSVSLAITTRSTRGVAFQSRETTLGPRLVVRIRQDDGGGRPPGE